MLLKRLRVLLIAEFLLLAVMFGVLALARGQTAMLALSVMSLVMAGFVALMFRLRDGAVRNAAERVRATLARIGKSLMDAPGGTVQDKWDPAVARQFLGIRVGATPAMDVGKGITVEGTHDGARWHYASYVAPDRDRMYVVGSHVRVDLAGADVRLRLTHEGFATRVASALDFMVDVQVGDEPFDKAFRIEGDPELLREVLDAPTRKALLALHDRAGAASSIGLDLEVAAGSLVLHWPGELTEEFAGQVRGLLLQVRGRLLDALKTRALTGVRVGGFRGLASADGEARPAEREPAAASTGAPVGKGRAT